MSSHQRIYGRGTPPPPGFKPPPPKQFKIEKKHPHGLTCENFAMALKAGLIIVIKGEPQIAGKPPKDAKMGNIITGEAYNPNDFMLNIAIRYCPFCGAIL